MPWTPVTYDYTIASAAIRLAFLRMFCRYSETTSNGQAVVALRCDATDWTPPGQKPLRHSDLCTAMFFLRIGSASRTTDAHIARIINNPYAIQIRNQPVKPAARAIIELSKSVFQEDESPELVGAIAGIQSVTQEHERQDDPDTNYDEMVVLLEERYEFIINKLRLLDRQHKDLNVLRLIDHYDVWMVQLAENKHKGRNKSLQKAAV
jgi:hypothetical protein